MNAKACVTAFSQSVRTVLWDDELDMVFAMISASTRRGLLFVLGVTLIGIFPLWKAYRLLAPSEYVAGVLEPIPGVRITLYGRKKDFTEPLTIYHEIVVNGERVCGPTYIGPVPEDRTDLVFRAIVVEDGCLIGIYETSHPHLITLYYDVNTKRYWPTYKDISPSVVQAIMDDTDRRFRKATNDPMYKLGRVGDIVTEAQPAGR